MVLDEFRLDGKTAIITGGSRGLGLSMAESLAEVGVNIVVASRDEKKGMESVSILEKIGKNITWVKTDVSNHKDVEHLIEKTILKFGKIDILINCAGIGIIKPAIDHTEEDWIKTFNINLLGSFNCCKAVAQSMIEKDNGGSIINISSIQGLRGYKNLIAYSSSKAGVIELTKVLANEWARYKIRVNSICPGLFETDFTSYLKEDAKLQDQIKKFTPLRRFGKPRDLSGAVLYLASGASSFMTGQLLIIDGGISIQ